MKVKVTKRKKERKNVEGEMGGKTGEKEVELGGLALVVVVVVVVVVVWC